MAFYGVLVAELRLVIRPVVRVRAIVLARQMQQNDRGSRAATQTTMATHGNNRGHRYAMLLMPCPVVLLV